MTDATQTPDILKQAPAGRVVLWSGEVATLAGVTVMTVTRWAKAGKIESTTTAGGNRRYSFPAVAALLAEIGRPVPWWLNAASQAAAEVAAGTDLGQLAADLAVATAWLREDCTDEHAEDVAEVVWRAWRVIEDLAGATP